LIGIIKIENKQIFVLIKGKYFNAIMLLIEIENAFPLK